MRGEVEALREAIGYAVERAQGALLPYLARIVAEYDPDADRSVVAVRSEGRWSHELRVVCERGSCRTLEDSLPRHAHECGEECRDAASALHAFARLVEDTSRALSAIIYAPGFEIKVYDASLNMRCSFHPASGPVCTARYTLTPQAGSVSANLGMSGYYSLVYTGAASQLDRIAGFVGSASRVVEAVARMAGKLRDAYRVIRVLDEMGMYGVVRESGKRCIELGSDRRGWITVTVYMNRGCSADNVAREAERIDEIVREALQRAAEALPSIAEALLS